jgi:hypothetical protein|tara:strand:- start:105 stop:752 length:648 start_codon:yes stop_codon:yes gene_type:complete
VAEYEANQESSSTNAEADIYDGVSDEQKGWQRQLNRAREQNKELLKGYLELGETKAALSRVEGAVESLIDHFAQGSYGDSPLTGVKDSLSQQRQTDTSMLMHRNSIADVLHDNDSNWDSEQMEEARTKWDTGDYAGALTSVQSAFSQPVGDIEAEVEQRVQERLRQGGRGVDPGSSMGAGQKRMTVQQAGDVSPSMSDEDLRTHADTVLDQFFRR